MPIGVGGLGSGHGDERARVSLALPCQGVEGEERYELLLVLLRCCSCCWSEVQTPRAAEASILQQPRRRD